MRILAITLITLLLPGYAFGKDFRTLNYTEDCGRLDYLERQEGSLLQDQVGRFTYSFENIFLDRAVRVIYVCNDKNKFKKGMYYYEFENLVAATQFHELVKLQLVLMYGEPIIDTNEDENPNIRGLFVVWKSANSKISLSTGTVSEHSDVATMGIVYESDQ